MTRREYSFESVRAFLKQETERQTSVFTERQNTEAEMVKRAKSLWWVERGVNVRIERRKTDKRVEEWFAHTILAETSTHIRLL